METHVRVKLAWNPATILDCATQIRNRAGSGVKLGVGRSSTQTWHNTPFKALTMHMVSA